MSNTSLSPRILAVDDDATYRMGLNMLLSEQRYQVKTAAHSGEALALIAGAHYDLVILDMQMRHESEGLEAIPKLLAMDPDLSIIISSARTDFETVRKALLLGARDYVSKETGPAELLIAVQRTLEKRQLLREQKQYRAETKKHGEQRPLIGQSKAIAQLRNYIEKARQNRAANVLIYGETGVGKEVVARMLRRHDDGAPEPFISVDSATIHSNTAESILFGHEKGAFTGADTQKKGIFEEASGGLVYFDEISNMPLEIQNKLLRVIQEKEVKRLGTTKSIPLDFRVVAATNKDLDDMVRKGAFKEDLLQRLNVIPLRIPPLRDRLEDLQSLTEHFCRQHQVGERLLSFSKEAWQTMLDYAWPGNVRELQNTIIFLYTMTESEEVQVCDLPPKLTPRKSSSITPMASDLSLNERVAQFEEKLLRQEIEQTQNLTDLANRLKISRSNLYAKMKRYGLENSKT